MKQKEKSSGLKPKPYKMVPKEIYLGEGRGGCRDYDKK